MALDIAVVAPAAGLGAAVFALAVAGALVARILRADAGDAKMREISQAILEGAMAFLKLEYRNVAMFAGGVAVVFVIVGAALDTARQAFWFATALGFVVGAAFSALAGFIGMAVSTRANVRVAQAARAGTAPALSLAVKAGAVNGFAVVGLGILGLSGFYLLWRYLGNAPQAVPLLLVGFAFGGSLMSLFARVGGGIYTKAADVGTDLVGKIEAGIPEDDPRNPGVIADNVGDNVGDCAGMGADLFETYAVTLIATMLLAASAAVFAGVPGRPGFGEIGLLYPVLLGAVAIVASAIGLLAIRLPASGNIMNALYQGIIVTAVLAAVLFYIVTVPVLALPIHFFFASLIGLAITLVLIFVTDFYTSKAYRPVKSIGDASTTGAATVMIQGLAVGLESVVIPVITIVVGMIAAFLLGEAAGPGLGLFGIGVAAVGMLSVTGIVVTIDTYGPVTDNAGGIAEMAGLPKDVRKVTDALDAVGNTTKATTKGYAIGSAALAALVLFADYVEHANEGLTTRLNFSVDNPAVLAGMLLGAAAVFLFGALAMVAVGKAAMEVVNEVRRQFREDKGIMTGKSKPDYARCVAIVTKRALKEMAAPALLAVGAPLVVGFVLGPEALGGLLIGVIVAGLITALFMANAGGAWDNGKKYIEDGMHGGKGSEAHKAAVVGDTVGDPLKDTAGPAINPLIKAINTISVIFASLIVQLAWLRF
ncbi:MAG TPA: sodium-translocating pyrophosphatase [Candidatus Thermoplasmatota archaeon]|jgi:K(+)-stimulated pyrophosphate-energized sodium pump|nr:sodium-translocating pyrophosphatase [Candidatus Thermoplasmatota archaeon]